MLVLQAEDDANTAKSVELMLKSEGHDCESASLGEGALRLVQEKDWCSGEKLGVRFLHDDRAATAVEYALIVGLVFLAIVASVELLSQSLSDMYFYVSTNVLGSMGSGG